MGLLSLLLRDPIAFFLLVPLLLYSVIAHEVAHGWIASLFGDNTAKSYGRLSLNPKSHLDPMGTLALFLIGFGWAKPVPVDYRNLGSSRRVIVAVSLAGCVTNILIATIALFLLHFYPFRANHFFAPVLLITAKINIVLGSFNLIPIPPLDGSRVLMAFLPYDAKYKLARLEPYGFFIIVILLWTGILSPVITFVQNLILGLIGILLNG
ncbi:MAG: site-2 protease family protein [Candidatus Omnitrophica bacterium]|nr:site-2 protease family protein [Candidatus Omnitrophota bacterium]